jgi:hypothetical protein
VPAFVRSLAFVAEIAAHAFEAHDFQLLPVGVLETLFGYLVTSGQRLSAIAELYRRWDASGAPRSHRYYLHAAEPTGALLVVEAHDAGGHDGGARADTRERQIIRSIAQELGITADFGERRRGQPGQLQVVRAASKTGRDLEIATRIALTEPERVADRALSEQRTSVVHVCTRVLVVPLAELINERAPGLTKFTTTARGGE